jgi:hypothetical protein
LQSVAAAVATGRQAFDRARVLEICCAWGGPSSSFRRGDAVGDPIGHFVEGARDGHDHVLEARACDGPIDRDCPLFEHGLVAEDLVADRDAGAVDAGGANLVGYLSRTARSA